MAYKIFSDTGSNYTDEMAKEKNVTIIPLSFFINGKEYKNSNKQIMEEVYAALRRKENVTTGSINTFTFEEAFTKELEKGNDIIYLAFSSGLSGTYQNAMVAKKNLEEKYPDRKIIVIDSLSATLGQGLLLTYACEFRDSGESLEDVASFIEANKLRMSHLFTVDEMFYLYRGGRITKATYLVARFAAIKPIMHVDDEGHLQALGKVIGRKATLKKMIEMIVETIDEPEKQYIYIAHGDCQDDAMWFKNELEKRFKSKGIFVDYLTPVIGAHSGPGTMAIFYLSKHRI